MSAHTGSDRRQFVLRGLGLVAASMLTGCDGMSRSPYISRLLATGESLTRRVQRALPFRRALAPEFPESARSAVFPPNGSTDPDTTEYRDLAARGFADWQLEVRGLVERPSRFSLADLRRLPSRAQITRHDCVEGWSAIAKWTGVPLGAILDRVGVLPRARYVVVHCADTLDESGDALYYESVDLEDAVHPQTILAYEMNDRPLPVAHGAPLRLRVERQLGYKMAKYVMAIELVESFARIEGGRGGYWEDRGYEWYAGI